MKHVLPIILFLSFTKAIAQKAPKDSASEKEPIAEFGGEIAMDFMFWPFARHGFGWYLEPAYQYNFDRGHDQSIGVSGGLLLAIP